MATGINGKVAVMVNVDGLPLVANYKAFATGSEGFYVAQRVTIDGITYRASIQVVREGSKNEVGAADRAAQVAQERAAKARAALEAAEKNAASLREKAARAASPVTKRQATPEEMARLDAQRDMQSAQVQTGQTGQTTRAGKR